MQRFKGDTLLQKHLEEAACLQHSTYLEPLVRKSLPPPTDEGKPPRLTFTVDKKKFGMPICVCMDYEMFWDSIDAAKPEANHAYTTAIGMNTRVASYGYFTSAIECFDIPDDHKLKLYR